MEMREQLSQTLDQMLQQDDRVIVMDADLASANGTAGLRSKYPKRALDVGISEANMIGMAAGMSAYGYKPIAITFTAFATRRVADQIAISGAYAKQNIMIIGTDSGVTSQTNGGTHMSFEDIGIMRSIPEVAVVELIDEYQLAKALPVLKERLGVKYVRMVRKDTPRILPDDYVFDINKGVCLREGSDLSIIASGICVHESLMAAEYLAQKGVDAEVIAIHTIKPIDQEILVKTAQKTKRLLVVENHNIHGGLFSAVAEVLSQRYPAKIMPLGIKDHFGEVGNTAFLMEKYGISCNHIVEKAKSLMD